MSKLSKMDEILLSGNPTQFVKMQSRQNGKAKPLHFDSYQYEYHGYAGCDKKPVFVCRKCNTDYTWLKRVIHRVFFSAYEICGNDLRKDGLWSNLDAVISLRKHYRKIGLSDSVPYHPKQEPVPLLDKGLCLKCRRPVTEERSLF